MWRSLGGIGKFMAIHLRSVSLSDIDTRLIYILDCLTKKVVRNLGEKYARRQKENTRCALYRRG